MWSIAGTLGLVSEIWDDDNDDAIPMDVVVKLAWCYLRSEYKI